MMYSNVDFKNEYIKWIRENTESISMGELSTRLTTPFLDMNNDCIEVYIRKNENGFMITDLGETVSNLEFSLFRISEKRKSILQEIVRVYGVSITKDNELYTLCTMNDFGIKVNSLIQCMIKVSDMLMLSDRNVKVLFYEEVKNFFDKNDVLYTSNLSVVGKSSFYATYDFVLPKSKRKPERFIAPINNAREDVIRSTIFTWEDIKPYRDSDTVLFAIINDKEKKVSEQSLTALDQYGIEYFEWSKREENLHKLKSA